MFFNGLFFYTTVREIKQIFWNNLPGQEADDLDCDNIVDKPLVNIYTQSSNVLLELDQGTWMKQHVWSALRTRCQIWSSVSIPRLCSTPDIVRTECLATFSEFPIRT